MPVPGLRKRFRIVRVLGSVKLWKASSARRVTICAEAPASCISAAMSIADGIFDPAIASRAKLQIGRSGRHIGQEAIQLHGGIGVTAEYPVGHYMARLTAIEHTLGSTQEHLRLLSERLGDHDLARL